MDSDCPMRRRVQWIEQALAPLRPRLDAEQFERLTSALALVVGWKAMTVTWAARALVEAMLAESTS